MILPESKNIIASLEKKSIFYLINYDFHFFLIDLRLLLILKLPYQVKPYSRSLLKKTWEIISSHFEQNSYSCVLACFSEL